MRRIFSNTNKFGTKYSNIFEYPNIRYTLARRPVFAENVSKVDILGISVDKLLQSWLKALPVLLWVTSQAGLVWSKEVSVLCPLFHHLLLECKQYQFKMTSDILNAAKAALKVQRANEIIVSKKQQLQKSQHLL